MQIVKILSYHSTAASKFLTATLASAFSIGVGLDLSSYFVAYGATDGGLPSHTRFPQFTAAWYSTCQYRDA